MTNKAVGAIKMNIHKYATPFPIFVSSPHGRHAWLSPIGPGQATCRVACFLPAAVQAVVGAITTPRNYRQEVKRWIGSNGWFFTSSIACHSDESRVVLDRRVDFYDRGMPRHPDRP